MYGVRICVGSLRLNDCIGLVIQEVAEEKCCHKSHHLQWNFHFFGFFQEKARVFDY